ncbi:MAG: hypothetical protein ABSG53_18060 [Thermoguttaceae bacterium]|jgi:hypothetical protein
MRRIVALIALSAVLLACCGCLATPNLAHPGTEAHQQARAQIFEPYPDNDVGPPVVGARPREYQDPRPETIRALQRPGEPVLVPCPPSQAPQAPQAPIAQPPIVTAPPAIYYPPAPTQP